MKFKTHQKSLAGKQEVKKKPVFHRSPPKKGSPIGNILFLQRTMGNQEVQRLLKSGALQAKLKIGQPNDKYEQEADRVADRVMSMPESGIRRQAEEEKEEIQTKPLAEQITPLVQRQVGSEEEEEPVQAKLQRQEAEEEEEPAQTKLQRQEAEEEEEPVQAKQTRNQAPAVSANIESGVNSLKGGGQPLPETTRSYFEPRFGADFSQVRVHTDSQAAETAKSVNAKAFTKGKDVVFGAGQYSPGTSAGKQLLAHELTHVVQQDKCRQIQLQPSKPSTGIDINTIEWKKGVSEAEKLAKRKSTKATAKNYYKALIIRASKKIKVPQPLVNKVPGAKDIRWAWKSPKKGWAAFMDGKRVNKFPNDYWKWLLFSPGAIVKEEAWTVSMILHELDHAAHAKALHFKWQSGGSKGNWDKFWIAHFQRWSEKAIKVGESAGLIGTLAGLPEKIEPSVIEFRAYTNQFVNFFHKYSIDKQDLIAKALILYYPLKKQNVKETIKDPALDLAASRNKILDYFKSPPVKNASQKQNLKIRIASEFKSALLFFRPSSDIAQIKKDFAPIFNFSYTPEERKDASKNYKPQGI